jgi:hypothetical protein
VEERDHSGLPSRRTKRADALIAGAYFAGTNTRRVRRALAALFGGAVGWDTVFAARLTDNLPAAPQAQLCWRTALSSDT